MIRVPKHAKPAVDLALHFTVGSFAFLIFFAVAAGVAHWIDWFEARGAPTWMINGGHWIEWIIFWLDAFCYGLFLAAEAIKFARGVWKGLKESW